MFKPLPPEANSSVVLGKDDQGKLRVDLDSAGMDYLIQNFEIVNEIVGTDFTSFADMCERDPNTAYGFLRSALLRAYKAQEDLNEYLPSRSTINIKGREVSVGMQATDTDRLLLGESAQRLALYVLKVTTDQRVSE